MKVKLYKRNMRMFYWSFIFLFSFCSYSSPPIPIACTLDINPWGHPTSCDCGELYFWNEVIGICQIKEKPCTRDINEWGFPSICECYIGYQYNPTIGECYPTGI